MNTARKLLTNISPGTGEPADSIVRGKIRLPKVEHPKFEGHVTPNEEEFQKSMAVG